MSGHYNGRALLARQFPLPTGQLDEILRQNFDTKNGEILKLANLSPVVDQVLQSFYGASVLIFPDTVFRSEIDRFRTRYPGLEPSLGSLNPSDLFNDKLVRALNFFAPAPKEKKLTSEPAANLSLSLRKPPHVFTLKELSQHIASEARKGTSGYHGAPKGFSVVIGQFVLVNDGPNNFCYHYPPGTKITTDGSTEGEIELSFTPPDGMELVTSEGTIPTRITVPV